MAYTKFERTNFLLASEEAVNHEQCLSFYGCVDYQVQYLFTNRHRMRRDTLRQGTLNEIEKF